MWLYAAECKTKKVTQCLKRNANLREAKALNPLRLHIGIRHETSNDFHGVCFPDHGVVYAVRNPASGLVKIGSSKRPRERIQTLETMAGCRFTPIYVSAYFQNPAGVERRVHERFTAQRRLGEWFEVSIADAIAAIEEWPSRRDKNLWCDV